MRLETCLWTEGYPMSEDERWSDLEQKYSRDGGGSSRISIGEIADKLLATKTTDEFCDIMDAEFLAGAWKHALDGMHPHERRLICKDFRGLAFDLMRKSKLSAHSAGRREGLEEAWKKVAYWGECSCGSAETLNEIAEDIHAMIAPKEESK